MSDLISRNEALNTLCECCSDAVRCNYTCIKYDSILHIPTVDAMPKWISVEERLPDRQCEYLVRYGFGEPIIQSYSGVMYFVLYDERPHFENDGLYGLKVTHWMPLPEPPKEDE